MKKIFAFLVLGAGLAAPALALAPRSQVPVAVVAEYAPQVQVLPSREVIGETCAREMADLLLANNAAGRQTVFGLATGDTPQPTYRAFIRICREERIDLSRLRTFNLDEYRGLPPDHPASYIKEMRKNLIDDMVSLGFNPTNFHILNGLARQMKDLSDEERAQLDVHFPQREKSEQLSDDEEIFILNLRCREYEALIEKEGPIDLQILGIGENGHIGFAEPGAPWDGKTAIVELTENTRRNNARFFGGNVDAVPHCALSMGIATILQARRIILLAAGEKKAVAIRDTVFGPLTPQVPAASLRQHPNVQIMLDPLAASLINGKKDPLPFFPIETAL